MVASSECLLPCGELLSHYSRFSIMFDDFEITWTFVAGREARQAMIARERVCVDAEVGEDVSFHAASQISC